MDDCSAAGELGLQQKEKPGKLGEGGHADHQQRVGPRAKFLKKNGLKGGGHKKEANSGSNPRRKKMEVEKPREKEPCPSCPRKHQDDTDKESQTNRQTGRPRAPRIRGMCGIRSEVT